MDTLFNEYGNPTEALTLTQAEVGKLAKAFFDAHIGKVPPAEIRAAAHCFVLAIDCHCSEVIMAAGIKASVQRRREQRLTQKQKLLADLQMFRANGDTANELATERQLEAIDRLLSGRPDPNQVIFKEDDSDSLD